MPLKHFFLTNQLLRFSASTNQPDITCFNQSSQLCKLCKHHCFSAQVTHDALFCLQQPRPQKPPPLTLLQIGIQKNSSSEILQMTPLCPITLLVGGQLLSSSIPFGWLVQQCPAIAHNGTFTHKQVVHAPR